MSLSENEEEESSSPSNSHSHENNNNNKNNDDHVLLSRFFDRIGIKKDDRTLLMDDEGIVTITDLLTRGSKSGSYETNLRLSTALSYVRAESDRLGSDGGGSSSSPREVLERIVKIEKWSKNSWESHMLSRFDEFLSVDDMDNNATKIIEYDSSSQRSQDEDEGAGISSSLPSDMTPEQLRKKVEEKLQKSNLRYTIEDDTNIVNLQNKTTGAALPVPMAVLAQLFLHQTEGIVQIFSNYDNGLNGILLADEMGLG